ncbi:MAG TPA: AraC family transcriptional regulator [Chthoniobacterales bacterium]|nr:AraC family transcriptional regulator [Chthoniobacterales bacterium]
MAWENSNEPAVGLLPVMPDATSQSLGWVGLQAFRYRDAAPNEVHWPPLSQHLLVLTTRPPAKMSFRYEGGKRDLPSPAGSITVMPVGSEAELCWQGTADCLHIYLNPKLTARVATTSLGLDVSHTAIPPLDGLILPELRTAMLAVDAELTTGGLGGPLMIESLANILAVRLLRYIFGRRRRVTRTDGVLTRRKLTTMIDYLMANLHRSPTLEQMAALVSLGPYHFARQFKAATGLPPHQFLITRRVERAQQILRGGGNLSLAEVAIGVGFSDQSQLCFHFKRIVGLTPGRFRASAKST